MDNDFYLSGIIQGKGEDIITNLNKNDSNDNTNDKNITKKNIKNFLSTVQNIKSKLLEKYVKDQTKYIYTRFNTKKNILNIYVTFLNDTKLNRRRIDITFLIVLTYNYPINPPLVYCLSVLNDNFDFFDMRNIQKNIIPYWSSSTSTIFDIIENIPELMNSIDFQLKCELNPKLGEYMLINYEYDINDFLLNTNNKIFKILIPNSEKSDEVSKFYEKYLIITKNNLLILTNSNPKFKNICFIEHIIGLFSIDRIRRFIYEEEIFNNLSCFKFVYNKNSNNNSFDKTICVQQDNLMSKTIYDMISQRKELLINNFKYFEISDGNSIKQIEQIIMIKQKIIEHQTNDNIFWQIQMLYNQIIEKLTTNGKSSDRKLRDYVDKLKTFLKEYDQKKNKNDPNDVNQKNSNNRYSKK